LGVLIDDKGARRKKIRFGRSARRTDVAALGVAPKAG